MLKYCILSVYSYASSPGEKKYPVCCAVVEIISFPCECAVTKQETGTVESRAGH